MFTIEVLEVGDDPLDWAAAGFALSGAEVVVGGVRIRCTGDGGDLNRWVLRAHDVEVPNRLDGIRTSVATDRSPMPPPVPHPNGVTAFDHVVLRSPDLDRTTAAIEALGVPARRTRDFTVGDSPVRQRFFRTGEVIIELVGTPEPTGDGPATIWGYAFVCDDLDATAAFLGPRCSAPKDAVQPGRRIATLRTRDLGISAPVALMSPHVRP